MKAALIVFAVVAAMCSHGAFAQDVEERFDFKGIKLGTPLAEVRAAASLHCSAGASTQFDTICMYKNKADKTYAGLPAQDIMFGFFADRLDSVIVLTKGADYEAIKSALDSKFGEVTAGPGLAGVATYMRNGDRIHVLWSDGQTMVRYEAAAGVGERAKRAEPGKVKRNKDM